MKTRSDPPGLSSRHMKVLEKTNKLYNVLVSAFRPTWTFVKLGCDRRTKVAAVVTRNHVPDDNFAVIACRRQEVGRAGSN